MRELRTQVAIIGAGPAGLALGHLLHAQGIDNIILERRSRDYVEHRVRAGVLEYGIVEMLDDAGLGARMRREGLVHHGIELRFENEAHRINFLELADGRAITVYGQQEVVKDLIEARLAFGGPLYFESEVTSLDGLDGAPSIEATSADGPIRVSAAYVVGCDGSHGVTSTAIPASERRRYERVYPFAWLGILAHATPVSEELIYSRHERGFALYSMRSPDVVRLYLGVSPEEKLENWSDERIWDELAQRLSVGDGLELHAGEIFERGITAMRNIVHEPMRHGRLLLAGDAAHIVPPTGAKGMNLALADVRVLVPALVAQLRESDSRLLDAYSDTCLRHVWRAEEFSTYMTQMLHPHPSDDFENHVQVARLRQVVESEPTARALARHYVDACSL